MHCVTAAHGHCEGVQALAVKSDEGGDCVASAPWGLLRQCARRRSRFAVPIPLHWSAFAHPWTSMWVQLQPMSVGGGCVVAVRGAMAPGQRTINNEATSPHGNRPTTLHLGEAHRTESVASWGGVLVTHPTTRKSDTSKQSRSVHMRHHEASCWLMGFRCSLRGKTPSFRNYLTCKCSSKLPCLCLFTARDCSPLTITRQKKARCVRCLNQIERRVTQRTPSWGSKMCSCAI